VNFLAARIKRRPLRWRCLPEIAHERDEKCKGRKCNRRRGIRSDGGDESCIWLALPRGQPRGGAFYGAACRWLRPPSGRIIAANEITRPIQRAGGLRGSELSVPQRP
jgi:hypothetical protein